MVAWWLPPKQRQRWGDTQILPSGTWGNIFFDLFYVGGAYNLGNMIKNSNYTLESILYFCGAGFPIMVMWFDKMYYDARFTTRPGHDVAHRVVEVIQICAVATALSRLRSPQIMANSTEHSEMFQFTLSLFLISFITILKYIEVIWHGVGDPAAKVAARRDIKWRIVPTLWFLTATLESGMHYFWRSNDDDDDNRSIHRPIWYCLAGWVSWIVFGFLEQVVFAPKQQCHQISVPMNVHFCMHRYGEWFMVMFGESIISLLIVDSDNESISYTVAFYSGILSVIFLAHLHFRSEPKHVDDHALSRSRISNFVYTVMVPIYSAALIAIGVSYKMFLYEFMYKDNDDNTNNNNGGGYNKRELGGGGDDDSYETSSYGDSRKQFAANVFSASMTIAFVCIDFMLLTHKGIHFVRHRFQHMSMPKLVGLSVTKICLMVLLASLSSFQYDLHVMAFCGLGAILVNEFLRNSFMAKEGTSATSNSSSSHDQQQQQQQNGGAEKMMDDMTYCTALGSLSSSSSDGSSLDETVSVLAKFEQEQPPPSSSEYNHLNDNDSSTRATMIPEDNALPNIDYSRMAEI